jgi:hypothetical protein
MINGVRFKYWLSITIIGVVLLNGRFHKAYDYSDFRGIANSICFL